MESIIQKEKKCFFCDSVSGGICGLESHHIFPGSNRKWSEKYGLKVWLCGDEHHRNGPLSVHRNREVANRLKAIGQAKFEETYGTRQDFVRIFGRNYI